MLRSAGFQGVIFDKDNTLTVPYKNELHPALLDTIQQCKETFGESKVVIFSNTAGLEEFDPQGIGDTVLQ